MRHLASFVFVLGVAGCATTGKDPYFTQVRSSANVYVAPASTPVSKVAVMPFKASTELIGASVSDMVVTELLRAKRYTLVERGQMARVLSEAELAMAGLSQSRAMEVAKMLGADGVVIGTVDEYGTQARRGKTYAVVGVSMRLVNAANGQILWSADLARIAEDADIPTAVHARAVVHEIMAGLYQKWGVQKFVAPADDRRDPSGLRGGSTAIPPSEALLPELQAPRRPAPPARVVASDMGLRSVTLSWKSPTDSAHQIHIERSTSPQGPFARIATTAAARGSYTDRDGLKDATTYYYRLVALDRSGAASDSSPVVESMTAPPPDPPQNVTVVASASREVTVSWTAPRSPGVSSYRIERASASAPTQWCLRGETPETSFVDGGKPGTDFADSTWYLYRVTAVNTLAVLGSPSAPVKVKTLPPPAGVKDFVAVPNQVRCVPLSWAESSESDVVGYEIEWWDSSATNFTLLKKIPSRTTTRYLHGKKDPGTLQDATRYEYRIRAFNRVGASSAWTTPQAVTTRPPPPAPESVAARGGLPRMVELFWSPSPDEKAVGYEVERAEGHTGPFVLAGRVEGRSESFFTDRAGGRPSAPAGRLKDNTRYRYRVRARNIAGALSAWSEETSATTKPTPVVPTGLKATDHRPKAVDLVWNPNPEKDIAHYVIEARDAEGSRWREVGSSRKPAFLHTGLSDGARKVYRIKAVDKDTLESAWSDEATGRARPLPPPPQNVTATWTAAGAHLAWDKPEQEIAEYCVYRKGFLFSTEKLKTVSTPEADIGFDTLQKGITVFVTAVDTEGLESKPSATLELRPPAAKP